MERKTLLFILPYIPYPLESGGHQALFNGIKAVLDDYSVFVAFEADYDDDYKKNEADFLALLPGVTVLPVFRYHSELKLSQRIFGCIKEWVKELLGIKEEIYHPRVFDSWIPSLSPLNNDWSNHLSSFFACHHVDVVQVEMPPMMSAVYYIPKGVKKVYVHHEIAFVRHEQELETIDDSLIARAHAESARIIETNLLNLYDAVITLSDIDRIKLVDAGVKTPVFVSKAIVDTELFAPSNRLGKVLSFVGPDSHNPNYVGVMWFLENCWGQLKSKDNEYRFQIIGKWSESREKDILEKYSDVSFLGFVKDLGDALRDTVMIVPITVGSGIRMKILEAASRGVPFVSTSIGAEGLPLIDGIHCFIKDDPDAFVDAIFNLNKPDISNRMIDAAYKLIRENYSFSSLKENRIKILESI